MFASVIIAISSSSILEEYGKNMYKTVLLTDNEIILIRKVIGKYLNNNLTDIDHKDVKNLHIIDRTLIGKKPTRNTAN